MEIRPILSALLRNRAGAILVALQIAITLAIVVNAIYVTQQRVEKIGRPTGIDDQNIFAFTVTGFEKNFDFQAMVREDMALLRQMPGIVDAAPIRRCRCRAAAARPASSRCRTRRAKSRPLTTTPRTNMASTRWARSSRRAQPSTRARSSTANEDQQGFPPVAIVSQGLASALFPKQNALGKTFYDDQSKPYRIVGVIEHMHGSWVGWDKVDRVMLTPLVGSGSRYALHRARTGRAKSTGS